jgi:hypothetical protein
VDLAKIKRDEDAYQAIPDITTFASAEAMETAIRSNYSAIKSDIAALVAKELARISADPALGHLTKTKAGKK